MKVIIPKGVKVLNETAFPISDDCDDVLISDTVCDIDPDTFRYCRASLKTIEVDPNNANYKSVNDTCLTKDGSRVVFGCKTSLIPDGVRVIGTGAFLDCDGLQSIRIPNSVEVIESFAFCNCCNLFHMEIPSSVKSIGEGAFFHDDLLTSIVIPNSVQSIGYRAFVDSGVKSVQMPVVAGLGNCLFSDGSWDSCLEDLYLSTKDGDYSALEKAMEFVDLSKVTLHILEGTGFIPFFEKFKKVVVWRPGNWLC